jgi:hypothetical protein
MELTTREVQLVLGGVSRQAISGLVRRKRLTPVERAVPRRTGWRFESHEVARLIRARREREEGRA